MRRTPLHAAHLRRGARMVEFAGWAMPVYYTGILDEHRAVRERAGLFDVSHMGEIEVRGARALPACQRLVTNDAGRLVPGAAQYAVLCTPSGGIVDDVIYTCLAADRYLFCVNASNEEKDLRWMRDQAGEAEVVNRSAEFALLALQGPRAAAILQPLTGLALAPLRSFFVAEGEVAGARALVSRTGYTGENGFEIYLAPADAEGVWERLLSSGAAAGLVPVGLGARDTLRLEKALLLYGNDIDEDTTPLEAGLDWVVKLDKGDFIGRDALVRQRAEGLRRRLVGLRMDGGAPPRHGYRVLRDGRPVGVVTSGTKSPTLGCGIALAMVERSTAEIGTRLEVEIRSRQHPAQVVPLPFVRKRK
ncbi:MAG: glycine cleavage system aminomethyltransferase GcvT [Deltaproteobacteria bacterium]|nr:glycine cleavage system aminomethyltransferase GcvT [Deltaproteobacteria bacterium]